MTSRYSKQIKVVLRNGTLIKIPPSKPTEELDVLVIDEQILVHEVVKASLADLGIFSVRTAENAYYAARLCAGTQFDIIFIAFNIKSDKDGFHLLEELKINGHITKSTSVVFLSAETSAELVNCVVELKPTDFWVKPIDRKTANERVLHLLTVKRKLHRFHYCMDTREYASAIYIGQRHLKDTSLSPYFQHINRLIGEALMQLREFSEAEKFYRQLNQQLNLGWVKIALAKVLLRQDKEVEAVEIIETLKERKETRFMVHDLLAEYYIEHQDYAQAYSEIQMATKLAPRNIDRNQKSCQLARLNHDKLGHYTATQNMAKYAKNSIHDSPQLLLNVIRSGLDLAATVSDVEAATILRKTERLITQLQTDHGSLELKHQLSIIKVRILCLQGKKKMAEGMLKQELTEQEFCSVEDNLDKMKAFHVLGFREECIGLLDQIKHQIVGDSLSTNLVAEYIKQEALERSEIHFTSKELVNMANQHYSHKRFESAYIELSKAFTLSPHNRQVALSILKVLKILAQEKPLELLKIEVAVKAYDLLSKASLPKEQQQKFMNYSDTLELEKHSAYLAKRTKKAILMTN